MSVGLLNSRRDLGVSRGEIDIRDKTIKTPTLIIQGGRDTFGNMAEVSAYELSPSIDVRWMPDGDHSFKPRKISGQSQEGNWNDAIRMVAEFAQLLPAKKGGDHIP